MTQTEVCQADPHRWADAETITLGVLLITIGFLNLNILAMLLLCAAMVYGVWFVIVNN